MPSTTTQPNPPHGSMTDSPTHYEILALPPSLLPSTISPQTLRNAYRRALLQHHPDKAPNASATTVGSAKRFSVDQIAAAYTVLGDKKAKAEYDKGLKLQKRDGGVGEGEGFRTGVEVVDLDDLEMDDEDGYENGKGMWYRGCRCGEERGFEVREEDLEEAAGEGSGEVSVGCKGCSLWLRVLFGVVEAG